MSNSIAANDIIQNIDDLLAEYPVDECINILQEVVKQIDVRIKDLVNIHNKNSKEVNNGFRKCTQRFTSLH